ncbi:MAG: 4-hydroxyproline epimerase [Flavobacteriaceae bacterium]
MEKRVFSCFDGHTCGNPVRLISGGVPFLKGNTMADKRLYFMEHYDWIRKSLMFEPRGHDMMSGSMLFPPCDPKNDFGILFVETSGCLPMCGHGSIGTITMALENGLIHPKVEGKLNMETPAGLVKVGYEMQEGKVKWVELINVPSFLAAYNLEIELDIVGGSLVFDVAYGGNFYAIIDPQENFKGIENYTASELIDMSQKLRREIASKYKNAFIHPEHKEIQGIHHIMWTGRVLDNSSTARNAVFYGDKAIDRSPCGTGTSARLAQWHAKGKLNSDEVFIHESFIGSTFEAKVVELTKVGDINAIRPSVKGWAKQYGVNTITVDPEDDPFAAGFQVI